MDNEKFESEISAYSPDSEERSTITFLDDEEVIKVQPINSKIFETFSPLNQLVVLNSREYDNHIALKHSEIEPEDIKNLVENPINIYIDSAHCEENEQRYAYQGVINFNGKTRYLRAITLVEGDEKDQRVITCFLGSKSKDFNCTGEVIYGYNPNQKK